MDKAPAARHCKHDNHFPGRWHQIHHISGTGEAGIRNPDIVRLTFQTPDHRSFAARPEMGFWMKPAQKFAELPHGF